MISNPEDEAVAVPNRQINLKCVKDLGESVPSRKNRSERVYSIASVYRLPLVEYGIHRRVRSPLFNFELEFPSRGR
jgi:hypothetical protein